MSNFPEVPLDFQLISTFFLSNILLFPIFVQIIGALLLIFEIFNFYLKYNWRKRISKIIRAIAIFVFGVFLSQIMPLIY